MNVQEGDELNNHEAKAAVRWQYASTNSLLRQHSQTIKTSAWVSMYNKSQNL